MLEPSIYCIFVTRHCSFIRVILVKPDIMSDNEDQLDGCAAGDSGIERVKYLKTAISVSREGRD